MVEAHFLGLNCQSNIYGIAPLQCGHGLHKVLIATCENNVYCIEYSKNQHGGAIFSNREVQFTYIPGTAEITSLHAFNQACQVNNFAVGVAFTKKENDGRYSRYFNIYSDWEFGSECDLDNIAQGCLSIPLNFIPFHLTHSKLSINGKEEIVWLLSGNDVVVHLYREDKARQTYNEELCDNYFPEFEALSSPVWWMDIKNITDSRITAIGCKNGTVKVSLVKFNPDIHIESSWTIQHDGPITSVKLFEDTGLEGLHNCPIKNETDRRKIHLLVTNSIEVSVVYRDVLKNGLDLKHQKCLPRSNKYDVVSCGLVADIDMDGYNEILIGTFGQELLAYKWKAESEDIDKGSYVLFHQQTFASQLLQMIYVDIMGDGIKEILILTNGGLHVMQHDLKKAADVITQRMKWLLQNVPMKELEKYLKNTTDA
ncbi:hypothetical protein JTE90_011403 [Oedothorax gibbosus]|uniref:KICSTOR complex protein kaptin n=1 Tax=Oedothorax gibbosus TaxID=931172 RepID=A0AAV6U6Y2_9ARAC|nr:hypothetical protein JTE90_011403 [Oedothorax gibbosus]